MSVPSDRSQGLAFQRAVAPEAFPLPESAARREFVGALLAGESASDRGDWSAAAAHLRALDSLLPFCGWESGHTLVERFHLLDARVSRQEPRA